MSVEAGRGRVRRTGVAVAMLVALASAVPAANAGASPAGTADITARVGEELAVLIAADGTVRDVSTIPARIVRERRGDVVVVTVV